MLHQRKVDKSIKNPRFFVQFLLDPPSHVKTFNPNYSARHYCGLFYANNF